jgi:cystathionine beta-lyase
MKDATLATTLGRDPEANFGIVNPPVYRASTILFPTLERMAQARPNQGVYYGRYGTPTTFALEEAVAGLEDAAGAVAVGSGKEAITLTLLALLSHGEHLLVPDSVYGPVRQFCDQVLPRFGIAATYYDPLIGGAIAPLIRETTRVVYVESPGSLTFEVQDVPAIAAAAKARGCTVVMDNTWATPLLFKPYRHGVDVSIHAATKYLGGHSDLMMGVVTFSAETLERVRAGIQGFGPAVSPEDCALCLRGIRTLPTRLARHEASGLVLARWLAERPEVARVLHPALLGCPGHELWRRDFLGASGLFGLVLQPTAPDRLAAMLEGMELFGMGYSWGGYESLLIPCLHAARSVTSLPDEGPLLRIHVGLEDPDDLIADLERGFGRLAG